MAVNLISSNDIDITQSGSDISLNFTQNAIVNKNVYSTNETRIGTWIDGKPLYRKVIDFGTLPNNTEKVVNTDIVNGLIVKMYGIANYTSNNATQTPIPYVDCADLTKSMTLIARDYGTKIGIKTAMNYTTFSAYVVCEYTKTTD